MRQLDSNTSATRLHDNTIHKSNNIHVRAYVVVEYAHCSLKLMKDDESWANSIKLLTMLAKHLHELS